MKKRLSDLSWHHRIAFLCLFLFLVLTSFALRSVTLSSVYGHVEAELPLMAEPMPDNRLHTYEPSAGRAISATTPVVLLTTEAFYFGDLHAFGPRFSDVHNKFIIRHVDGAPNTPKLVETLDKWRRERGEKAPDNTRIGVFVPTEDIPMPIVIQVLAQLRASKLFDRVVIGAGVL